MNNELSYIMFENIRGLTDGARPGKIVANLLMVLLYTSLALPTVIHGITGEHPETSSAEGDIAY